MTLEACTYGTKTSSVECRRIILVKNTLPGMCFAFSCLPMEAKQAKLYFLVAEVDRKKMPTQQITLNDDGSDRERFCNPENEKSLHIN